MRISDWSSDVCSSDLRSKPFYSLSRREREGAAEGSGRVRTDSCPALTFPPALLAGPFLSQWERRRDLKEDHTHERTDPLRQSGPQPPALRPNTNRAPPPRTHPPALIRRRPARRHHPTITIHTQRVTTVLAPPLP